MLSFAHTKKNTDDIFAILGGGNIGLGLMAPIVSQSPFNYKIIATSSDEFLQKIVNSSHQFWLQHTGSNSVTHIKNVTIISRNFSDIVKLCKKASLLAICLTPDAMQSSAKAIAQGLIERYRMEQKTLKIFVLMNLPDCGKVVRETVEQEINSLLNYSAEAKNVCNSVEFIPTVVDRIVTKISEKEIKDQLKGHLLSCLTMDFIDQIWLNKQVASLLDNPYLLVNAMKQFNLKVSLFNAEKNFAFYTPSQVPEIAQFPDIKPVNNLKQLEAIKNKYINGPHAIMAWLGGLLSCKTIAESIQYPGMRQFIENMMDEEITPALMAEYSELTHDDLLFLKKLFFERCEQSIDDPVERVGRDPLRKINSGERVKGTLEVESRHHLNIPMSGLTLGIAAAILYAVKQLDPTNPECKKIYEIYCKRGSYKDVLMSHGSYSSALMTNILNSIATLEQFLEMQKAKKQPLSFHQKSEFSTTQVMHKLCSQPAENTKISKLSSYADAAKREIITFFSRSLPVHKKKKEKIIMCTPKYGRT